MGKTISTHNGSAAHRDHNIRTPSVVENQTHIDKTLADRNEILIDEPPREAYKRIFGEALAEYNTGKRADRQIADYYDHVYKDAKKHPVYEMVVQIGDRNDTGVNAPTERRIIKQFISHWHDRNPNLELIGAYIHADESDGTLHAHLDYIPVARGYTKGLKIQNGLDRALEQQGFKTESINNTAQIKWEARENAVLEGICQAYGIEVDHPKTNRPHLNTAEFKEYAEQRKMYQWDIDMLQSEQVAYQDEICELKIRSEMLKQDILPALENKKNILRGEIDVLSATKEQANAELSELTAQISDTKLELEVVRETVKKEREKLTLFEKFISLPQVKPLWDRFCESLRLKSKDRERDR